MKDNKDFELNKQVDETLNALEGLGKAQAPPFFYTRLEARMQEELAPISGPFAFLSNLKLSVALLSLFMILNVASIFLITQDDGSTQVQGEATLETFTEEYFTSSDQYENQTY